MQDRGIRRHHVDRLKEKRKGYWGYSRTTLSDNHGHVSMSPKQLGAVAQHPQMCSCIGCGNDRRHLGNSIEARTLQERSQIETQRKFGNEE